MATAKRGDGRPQRRLLIAYQCGRITSYALAGLLLGGALGGLIGLLDIEIVRRSLRALSAIALLLAALVAFGRVRDFGFGVGRIAWKRLAPIGRRLLPVTTLPRAFAFGMIWGWMPCGFVYTVLLIATLQLYALQAATIMIAFGVGTAPAMFATALGAQGVLRFGGGRLGKQIAGSLLLQVLHSRSRDRG